MYPGFLDLVEAVSSALILEINTNGILVTPQVADRLAKADLKCVQLSLDSADPAVHDSHRGDGSWRAARRAIELLRASGVPIRISMAVHAGNLHEVERVAQFARRAGASFSARAVKRVGRAITFPREELASEFCGVGDQPDESPFPDIPMKCSSQFGYIALSADGILKPCNMSLGYFHSIDRELVSTPAASAAAVAAFMSRHQRLFSDDAGRVPASDSEPGDCVLRGIRVPPAGAEPVN